MADMHILHDNDADLSVLNGKTIAVIGYGSQGRAQALCMRDSGLNVIIGIRPGKSFDAAVQDGFKVLSVTEAAREADIIHILLPDEMHGPVYRDEIAAEVTPRQDSLFLSRFQHRVQRDRSSRRCGRHYGRPQEPRNRRTQTLC